MLVLLGVDAVFAEAHTELFTDAYLRSLVAAGSELSAPGIFMELASSIRSGLIRGDRLYHSDLCVLLEALRRHLFLNPDEEHVRRVPTVIDVLLSTASPSSGETEAMRGVEAACAWFDLLGLQEDYRRVLVEGAIDGEVLRSGLSPHEVQQMGVHNEADAAALLRLLNARPSRRAMPGGART
ncbi:uncharacterized protein Tco025E_04725 [Trypanosoma conorhini]|uniref:Uncharacterized protein n=1 Tax=Trypanosoma conorhini TaxID=83891 RepID=A0A422PJ82_9TRYP|nr:uncharacterized protein Tco025E_04725 [Trypanosoma conorhini]RNF17782.1 hypothetical protein Tco025E_04725 [Trypanosoma conorhini]